MAHEARVPLRPEAFEMQVHEAVEDGFGRVGERRIVVMDHRSAIVPVFHVFVEIEQAVAAQCGVGLEGQPGCRIDACRQLDTGAVGVRDVGGERFADVAQFAGLHQLVAIMHIIEVDAGAGPGSCHLVSGLYIIYALSARGRVLSVVGEIVALGLAVADGYRGIGPVRTVAEVEAGLGIEEVPGFVHVKILLLRVAVVIHVVFVVVAVGLVMDPAILQVAEYAPVLRQFEGGFDESAAVELGGVGVVILVRDILGPEQRRCRSIGQVAIVIADELLDGEARNGIPTPFLVGEIRHAAESVLRQAFLPHEVGTLDILAGPVGKICEIGGEPVFCQLVVVTEFVVPAMAARIMGRG